MSCSESDALTFAELLNLIHTTFGRKPHLATLHRWRTKGIRGKKLNAWKFGGLWMSSLQDVRQLIGSPQQEKSVEQIPTPIRLQETRESQRQTDWRVLNAQQELERRFQFPKPTSPAHQE